ncbi:uncharacterized protein LOC129948049 [Eupeodes corollae]|uniref:uncharacterized protein LOC129948049 n=1 Tax=Eupeodes corollae TaxID=290404 RepID=UPI0024924CAC|nr:uncharacterized protein LOC129948049 [Eupeodes corollae]
MLSSTEVVFLVSLGFLTITAISAQRKSDPVVLTELGKVRGSIIKTERGQDVYAFRGIRYAEAPIGEKRFRAPSYVSTWGDDELDGTKDGLKCPQVLQTGQPVEQSEDCLFLNVYTRNLNGKKSPVIVYIHGGSNAHGSGHSLSGFGPRYLLDTDVVFVTFNYRLGPFGFLSLDSPEAPGNYAYLDQVMALQWVHHLIANFGGNPDLVTLIGTSAGGMAVTLHMASPLSRGLFHRAIAMSGSATSEIVLDSVKWSRKLAHETSCPMHNPPDVLSCLRKLPWETILKVCGSWEVYGFTHMKWGYTVDGKFMPAKLTDLFDQGNFTKMPILTGLTKDEFTYSVYSEENNVGLLNDISLNFEKYASELFMHDLEDSTKIGKLKKFYLGNKHINDQSLTHFGEIFSDSFIGHGVHRLVGLARKYVDVYYYRFDYHGRFGNYIDAEGNPRGVGHGDELLYFVSVELNPFKFTQNDPEWFMVERVVGMIASFAHNGFPQTMNETKWLPTNKTHLNTMYIDTNAELGYAPFTERFRLWDELYPVNSGRSFYYPATCLITLIIVPLFLSYIVGAKVTLGIFLFALALVSAQTQTNPIVNTSLGKIKGTILKTEKGFDFFAFRGIRYAEAPIGEKRFKAPIAINKSWDGELDATKDGFICPQIGPAAEAMSEDCLIVNVYSRNLSENANKPVIFYIHGGSDKDGASHSEREAGPQYIMESDGIVLVSLNYRLGALGFLSTRTSDAPGNFGYLDQVMALHWVHNNVRSFGGNPNSVTLMGFSAGAMAVSLHLASPLSRGLFHRAIAMSGSATNEQNINNLHWTRKLAHETSCPMFNPEDLLSCLRNVPWKTIVETCKKWDVYFPDMKWNYEVDGHFLDFRPTQYYARGNFSQVPIITGLSTDEFNGMAKIMEDKTELLNDIDLNLEKYAPEFFMHDFGDPAEKKVEKLKDFYFKNQTISKTNVIRLGEAFSDSFINHGVHRLVDLARKYVQVYYYRFDYKGSFEQIRTNEYVSHGDDQFYVFKMNKFGGKLLGPNDKDWFMAEKMVGIISTFAQTGFPPEFDGLKWQPSNKTHINTLYIDEKFKMDGQPYAERFQLWDSLFPVENSGTRGSICVMTIMLTAVAMVFSVFYLN